MYKFPHSAYRNPRKSIRRDAYVVYAATPNSYNLNTGKSMGGGFTVHVYVVDKEVFQPKGQNDKYKGAVYPYYIIGATRSTAEEESDLNGGGDVTLIDVIAPPEFEQDMVEITADVLKTQLNLRPEHSGLSGTPTGIVDEFAEQVEALPAFAVQDLIDQIASAKRKGTTLHLPRYRSPLHVDENAVAHDAQGARRNPLSATNAGRRMKGGR
jgi:hypothetical protein